MTKLLLEPVVMYRVIGRTLSSIAHSQSLLLLVATTLLVIVSLLMSRLRFHRPLWIRVVGQLVLFLGLTLLLQRELGSPLQPTYYETRGLDRLWQQLVEAGWWVIGARLVSGVARLFIVLENRPRETQIVSDLVAGAVAIATTLAIVNFAFDMPIQSLLATSGVIAIVLGLALQSTLSDVFSGIAVGIERPYKAGDLIWVEGGIEGRVLQVNWRSTHIVTPDRNIAVVPNSVIAKARLINRSAPSSARGATIQIVLEGGAIPEACAAVLNAATLSCSVMQSLPAASINLTELQGEGLRWDIAFSVSGPDKLDSAKTELLTQVHRHLRHSGIALAVSNGVPVRVLTPTISQLLEESELFGTLSTQHRELLLPYFKEITFMLDDVLMKVGEQSPDLLVIAAGAVVVTVIDASEPRTVYRMSPGETLGAVGAIMGSIRTATATALTPGRAYRLSKVDLEAVRTTKPELDAALRNMASGLSESMGRHSTQIGQPTVVQPKLFLSRLRNFLQVLDG